MSSSVRVSRGVWLSAELAEHEVARLAAVLDVLPTGTVISGPTAAALHGLWMPTPANRIDITVPLRDRRPERTTAPQRHDVAAHRRHLDAGEVVVVQGLPVTSVARTWCDLASYLTLPDLVAAGDSALHTGKASHTDLGRAVGATRRRPGARLARVAVSLLDGRSRSRPESHARVALVRAGLPAPDVNVDVHDEIGGWLAQPDLSYREARLAVEYQGADHAELRQMRKDAARMMTLKRHGWEVYYYTAEQVFGHPEVVVRDVRDALVRRAPHLLVSAVRALADDPGILTADGFRGW